MKFQIKNSKLQIKIKSQILETQTILISQLILFFENWILSIEHLDFVFLGFVIFQETSELIPPLSDKLAASRY
jgi:hypothetical protein